MAGLEPTFFPIDQKDFLLPKDLAVRVKEGGTSAGKPPAVLHHPGFHQVLRREPTTIWENFSHTITE
jgi:hypothetical protein